jgi:hypothetical protein
MNILKKCSMPVLSYYNSLLNSFPLHTIRDGVRLYKTLRRMMLEKGEQSNWAKEENSFAL